MFLGEFDACKFFVQSSIQKQRIAVREPCGQSYKQFTLVIYDSKVVIWGIFKSGTTLES